MDDLNPLERAVLEMFLDGDDARLGILREQLATCSVRSRELTGAGFFTNLHVPAGAHKIDSLHRVVISDVDADVPGLTHGAGFALFIENGVLDFLEGFSFGEPWPSEITGFQLRYSGGLPRDFAKLRESWLPT